MKKTTAIWAMIAITAYLACGCGEAVELSEEDSKRVANYSSDILSQHNQYSNSRLADVEEVKWEYQKQVDLEVKKKNFIAQQRAAGLMGDEELPEGDLGDGSTSETAEEAPAMPLEEAIGLEGTGIKYTGYEVVDSYPSKQVEGDVFMGMTAAAGDHLVVLHFELSNPAETDTFCDILSGRPQFRVKINGERHPIQQTILPNDLSKYSDVIPAGGKTDVVLISEVEASKADAINDLSLIVRSAEGRPEYKLDGSGGAAEGGETQESQEAQQAQEMPDVPIPGVEENTGGNEIDFNAEEPYGVLTYEMPKQ
ncbi:MAG: hypothetical protein K6F35_09235 [Lachnospiraceae bacterium]|nr:hypothetical protein [Lachnospiraceae bacterium]